MPLPKLLSNLFPPKEPDESQGLLDRVRGKSRSKEPDQPHNFLDRVRGKPKPPAKEADESQSLLARIRGKPAEEDAGCCNFFRISTRNLAKLSIGCGLSSAGLILIIWQYNLEINWKV